MSKLRTKMCDAFKTEVDLYLKSVGFKGSFPHFYRERSDRLDLLCF